MKKKYLITGGLVFIGKAIAKTLLDQNNFVVITDNNFRKKNIGDLQHRNLKIFKSDIRNKSNLKNDHKEQLL